MGKFSVAKLIARLSPVRQTVLLVEAYPHRFCRFAWCQHAEECSSAHANAVRNNLVFRGCRVPASVHVLSRTRFTHEVEPGRSPNTIRGANIVRQSGEASVAVISNSFENVLDANTCALLRESAVIMEEWAKLECEIKPHGGMEEWAKERNVREADNCGWYHGTWQYLRLLDMVAVPNWHREFYNRALGGILRRNPRADVLISAAADYGMLATLHEAIQIADAQPNIVVYDICKTPLRSCQWYADRHGLRITTKCGNIITGKIPEAPFDLIVTDEFLTVLKALYKPAIAERWRELLKPGGSVVTVAMIGGETTPQLREDYAWRARTLLERSNGNYLPEKENDSFKAAIISRFEAFASLHTRHMVSGESEIRSLLAGFDNVSCARIQTPGECVNPTESIQIIASVSE